MRVAQALPHRGLIWVWVETADWLVIHSLRFFLFPSAASLLLHSNLRLALLTTLRQFSRLFASCCHECSGISVRDNCFFSWSLYRFFGAPNLLLPSRSSTKKTALGILESSILATWPAQRSCCCSSVHSRLGRLARLRTSSLVTYSCHLIPMMERRQR